MIMVPRIEAGLFCTDELVVTFLILSSVECCFLCRWLLHSSEESILKPTLLMISQFYLKMDFSNPLGNQKFKLTSKLSLIQMSELKES